MQDDASLIKEYFGGDEETLEILFKRYAKIMFNFCLTFVKTRDEAEDIAQDTFLKAWRNLKKFDVERDFKVWLLSIARNTALDYLRKRKPVLFSQFENDQGENMLLETIADEKPLALEEIIKTEDKDRLNTAVQQLGTEERQVIYLHDTEEMTFIEMAEALNQSQNTLKSRYRRALIKLKSILSEEADAAPKSNLST